MKELEAKYLLTSWFPIAVSGDVKFAEASTKSTDEDKGNDLWRVFNVVQEKITQGDFHAALTGAKVRKVRKIKSFEKDLKVNKELFKLATALV